MTQLPNATQATLYAAIHCVNPDCTAPHPQEQDNRFCPSCGSPIFLQDRYLPLQRLGRGGFAVTHTVYDTRTQQERVLKVLTETGTKAVALFEQEAQVLSSLHHPGIPRMEADSYFEIAVTYPEPRSLRCLVMEKINGQTLEELLRQTTQGYPEDRVIQWFHQAIEILRLLHQRQIIHRDLKPANFMLRHDTNQLVVIDFGGAKQHDTAQSSSTRLFSPGYSPPEQVTGSTVQPASDFYALGRTLIHLLTKQYPPDLEDPLTGELQWRSHTQVSEALADLIDEMVQFDIRKRPAQAELIQSRLCQIAPPPSLLQAVAEREKAESQPLESVEQGAKGSSPKTENRGQQSANAKLQALKAKVGQVSRARHPQALKSQRQTPNPNGRSPSPLVVQPPAAELPSTVNRSSPSQASPSQTPSSQSPQAQTSRSRAPYSQGSAPTLAVEQPEPEHRGIAWFSHILIDTTRSAILAGVGGGLGTLLGFELGYRSPLGGHLSLSLWDTLRNVLPFLPLQLGAELFVFGAAGFGTALGLTLAGNFCQHRHPLRSSLIGSLGYLSGLVGLRLAALDSVLAGLVVFAELSTVFLTLGLGLPQPRWVYTVMAGISTTLILVSLATANVWFMVDFWRFLYPEVVAIGTNESSSLACLIVFSLLGSVLSGCLGISRYLLVPVVQWLR